MTKESKRKRNQRTEARQAIREFYNNVKTRQNSDRVHREWGDAHTQQESTYEIHNEMKDTSGTRRYRPIVAGGSKGLRFYISLGEPTLGVFQNEAKEQGKVAYLKGFREWTHEYIQGPAHIRIKLVGRMCFIDIVPVDAFDFEFVTSGYPIVQDTYVSPSYGSFDYYKALVIVANVSAQDGAIAVKSRVNKNRRTEDGTGRDISTIKRPYMIELYTEPVAYNYPLKQFNRMRYERTIMESWAPGHPHTGVHLRGVGMGRGVGTIAWKQPLAQHYQRDIGVDVPFMQNQNQGAVQSVYINTNADWPRASSVQKVKHETWGEREYCILVDAYNQFHVFPTEAILPTDPDDPLAQNVDTAHVQMAAPTLPAWCYKQTSKAIDLAPVDWRNGHWQVDQPDPDWKFDHEGKRAASIFYERVAYTYDSAVLDGPDSVGAPEPITGADFADFCKEYLGVQARHQATVAAGHEDTRYFVAPGIIQVTVVITRTGKELEDFTIALEVAEVRRPTTSPYCSMAVGYVWYDVPFGASKNKKQPDGSFKDERIGKIGQFVTLDIERYVNGTTHYSIFSVKDLWDGTELLTLTAGAVQALDLTSLSMVVEVPWATYETRKFPRKTGYPTPGVMTVPWKISHFAHWVIVGAKHCELMWPTLTPDSARSNLNGLELTVNATYWRDFITTLAASGPGWYQLALNDARDWTYGNYGAWRLAWLEAIELAIIGGHAYPADKVAIEKFLYNDLYVWLDPAHLTYVASPKFGWFAYADAICNYMAISPNTTFYVHPNGTWAYFNNLPVFFANGAPEGGYAEEIDVLSGYDINSSTVEHVIFDRVHFEMRTAKAKIGQHNTSFQKLYNKAVKKALDDNALEPGIALMEDSALRAVFTKESYSPSTPPYTDMTWLDLKVQWDAGTYYCPDGAIQGGGWHDFGAPYPPAQQKIIGMTMNDLFFLGAGYTAGASFPATNTFHVRFANPIVINPVPAK